MRFCHGSLILLLLPHGGRELSVPPGGSEVGKLGPSGCLLCSSEGRAGGVGFFDLNAPGELSICLNVSLELDASTQ